jgi:hypothetical protein
MEAKQEEVNKPAEEEKGSTPEPPKQGARVVVVGGNSSTKAAPRNLFKTKVNSVMNPASLR